MELLFKRNISDTITKILLCVFALGGFASASMAQQVRLTTLPRLSLGVNQQYVNYSGDINRANWYPDNRIWVAPKRLATGAEVVPESEILVPVFIENGWRNFPNPVTGLVTPGVTLQELSSFSFRVYFDSRALEFVEVVKEHPFTEEEATNLSSTHFLGGGITYQKPLAYNFEMVAAVNPANDYGRYFNRDATPAQDANSNYFGRTVTVTGTANSFFNLETTDASGPGQFKVLAYLKFKVANAFDGVASSAAVRNSHLYFDPTYICYNGINITKSRGDKLIEQMPLSNTDNNWEGYVNMFGTTYFNAYINKANDNMQYFNRAWLNNADMIRAEVEQRSVGLNVADHNADVPSKFEIDPYLPGSIRVKIMNYIPEFRFEAINYHTNIVPPAVNIQQSTTDHSKWTMVEPITADILQTKRLNYKNQSERAVRVSIVSNGTNATALAADQHFVMEDIIIETDQPWLRVRTAAHYGDPATNYEDKFNTGTAEFPRRRAFAQRINKLITTPNNNAYNPFVATAQTATGLTPRDFIMWVECDPALITPRAPGGSRDQDFCGEYIGHVTFRSKYDKYEKTSIQVRFIVVASPEEVTTDLVANSAEVPYGLKLSITPNDGKSPNLTKTLILGSSNFATLQSDSLAGEYVLGQPLGFAENGLEQEFDARFFIDPNIYSKEAFVENGLQYNDNRTLQDTINLENEWQSLVDFGYGDYTHYDGVYNDPGYASDNKAPRTNSRDIRSATGSGQSNMHYVQFRFANDGNTDWFPVVLKWDPKQLQGRNTCHLKYTHNSGTETVDMKTTGSFVFHDIHVNHFWIEYTVAKSNEYGDLDDNFGEDIIQANSWNLVSLPLDPINKNWRVVYPNAINVPYWYSNNQWQEEAEVKPGEGYFVKYLDVIDTKFQGAYIDRINSSNYPVRVSRGAEGNQYWNVIGALSKVVSVENISFTQYDNYEIADKDEMLRRGVWAYRPKRGYARVYHLYPGKGYFITSTSNSYLSIEGSNKSTFELPAAVPNLTTGFDMINVADASQNSADIFAAKKLDATYFELPPAPPLNMFDVRFSQNTYATSFDNSNNLVKMQGVTYPVTISFDKPRANYTVVDPITNEVYGEVKAGTVANVVINNSWTNAFKLLAEASDETFFINVSNNPVNTNTAELTFGIDTDANVSIAVYNTLGNEVAKLDLGYLTPGVFNRTIDIANLASGAYTVRMMAGNEVKVFMMNVVK